MMINDANYEYYVFSSLDEMNMDEIRKNVFEQKNRALELIGSNKED
jgi:hypothetical protein